MGYVAYSTFYRHCRDGGQLSTRDLQKMVQALPQYSEQIEKLSLHVDVSLVKIPLDGLHFDALSLMVYLHF